ncbi:MAG: beta-lactamase family protein [Turicibacter sp.]|nr:beta-lactamase family protein [Turicibacter sp.]
MKKMIVAACLALAACQGQTTDSDDTYLTAENLMPGKWMDYWNDGGGLSPENQAVSTTIEAYLRLHSFNGVALVAARDAVLLLEAHGMADVGNGIPLGVDSKFQIASLTKPFTAIAILQLAEAGELSLDQPISDFLPGVLNGEAITLHHLLTHSSGLFAGDSLADYSYVATPDQLIADAFTDFSLQFWQPGSSAIYSNLGYHLLGVVIEQVSGLSFGEYLNRHILGIASMGDSGINAEGKSLERLAVAYEGLAADNVLAPVFHPSTGFAAGGMHSTAVDLFRFSQAIDQNLLLSPKSTDLLFTSYYNLGRTYYGYGWFVGLRGMPRTFAHTGVLAGWRGFFLGHRDNLVTVILLSNEDTPDLLDIGATISQLVLALP